MRISDWSSDVCSSDLGRFDYRTLEGAINIPLVADRVALRVAGQVRRQDGRTENLNGGPDFDNIHQDGLRVSLLIEPTDQISSTTIFDYAKANERSGGLYQYRANPGVLGAIFGSPALGGILDAKIARDKGIQNGNFYGAIEDGIDGGQSDRKQWGIP